MKKEQNKELALEPVNMELETSPITLGDTVIQVCPVCKKEQQFKIYTGYRAVCETCGYEIHLK